ncbi:SDR family oxidoreductase [Comamonas jiangduensis]|jgi:NAD(P)-dependent dehydrogenase (short-subunit alcohol dehydrogenase family)|uniref:SDR family oxidoreductase n=1 Tax=Comamonas jiangduensis TaxID=1194168 RepID=A0ABV4IB36_9BURK
MLNGLSGKTAVLTGAGSGFGLECMRIAAKAGMQLVLVDVQADALAQSAEHARSLGAKQVMARQVDVGNAQAMDALAQEVLATMGAPHFVFNNAGVGGSGGLLWEQSVKDWEWVLNVNLWGVIHGVRVFTPMMLQAAAQDPSWQGHIVNTASMAGLLTPPNMGVYNVSKHAVVSLTETLYQDLRLVTEQLHCSVLCPYFVPTGIATSERNRPDAVDTAALTTSQKVARAMTQKAVNSGKVSAQDIASKVFAAMADNQFYIFSHPHALGNVRARMEDILQLQNPTDAFADRPELGEQLREALRQTSLA